MHKQQKVHNGPVRKSKDKPNTDDKQMVWKTRPFGRVRPTIDPTSTGLTSEFSFSDVRPKTPILSIATTSFDSIAKPPSRRRSPELMPVYDEPAAFVDWAFSAPPFHDSLVPHHINQHSYAPQSALPPFEDDQQGQYYASEASAGIVTTMTSLPLLSHIRHTYQ